MTSVSFDGTGELTRAIVNAGLGSATIVFISGYTRIGSEAFVFKSQITSVTIGSSVTSIGDFSFRSCTGLTSIELSNSVTSIDTHAFYGCTAFTSVTLPSSLTSIGDNAFGGCTGLTSIKIQSFLSNIVYVFDDANVICTFDYIGAIPNQALYGKSLVRSVIIGDGITSIGNQAFVFCTSLTSIKIGFSVTSIGLQSFASCSSLSSITIPSSVTSIKFNAFTGSGLVIVNIANGQVISGTTFTAPAINFGFFGRTVTILNYTPNAPKPAAPTGLTATTSGFKTVTITFTQPSNGSAPVTSYRYATSSDNITYSPFTSANLTKVSNTQVTISELTLGSTYYFKLVANNEYDSPESDASKSVVVNLPHDAPVITNVSHFQDLSRVGFTQTNNGLGAPISGYSYSIDNGVSFTSTNVTTSPLNIPGMKTGITNKIILKAKNGLDSNPSSVYNFTYYITAGKRPQ